MHKHETINPSADPAAAMYLEALSQKTIAGKGLTASIGSPQRSKG